MIRGRGLFSRAPVLCLAGAGLRLSVHRCVIAPPTARLLPWTKLPLRPIHGISRGFKVRSASRVNNQYMSTSSDSSFVAEPYATDKVEVELLTAINDDHGGIIVEMKAPMDSQSFVSSLRASISNWRKQGIKGVWLKLPIELANLVQPAVEEGFLYHHAEPSYLMLVYWIPATKNTLPVNASHRVGVGAFVMNDKREVLAVQEKSGLFRGSGVWKFPTGVVDQGEEIFAGAIREVKEETGIDTKFVEVLAFRQSHMSFFEKSDLFFVCLLHPISFDIQKQESEIEAAKWMPIDEYASQPFIQKHELQRYIIDVGLARTEKIYRGFSPVCMYETISAQYLHSIHNVFRSCMQQRFGFILVHAYLIQRSADPESAEERNLDLLAMAGSWIKLVQKGTGPGARSSHAITVVGDKAYAFGGEFTPRVPVDNKLHVFNTKDLTWSVPEVTGDVPPPRVGVTMTAVGSTIYVFGGRDLEHKELNELYSFDTHTNIWTLLSSGEAGPPHRSYHSVAADERRVYIFGGCGNSGRLNDLWAFDTIAHKWEKLPLLPACGRGGPGLAVCGKKIWVVYGFSGKELEDVHCFDTASREWAQVETTGEKPSSRSVFCSATVGENVIVYGGEIDPSDEGHMGAGKFSAEMFVLDTESRLWRKVKDAAASGEHPGPRGWCAFSVGKVGGSEGLLVYGGNSPTNDRLDDIFFFTPSI